MAFPVLGMSVLGFIVVYKNLIWDSVVDGRFQDGG